MNGVIPGLGGCANCQNCAAPNPCAGAAPNITACGSGSGCVGSFGSWLAYSSGQFLTGATWSMSAFDGLSINSSTGFISGTVPSAGSGNYNIAITAANGCGSSTCNFVLTLAQSPTITSSLTASATVGTAFSYTITSSGSPVSYLATGLPSGLSYNSSTGVISGTPTAAGTSYITLTAYDTSTCYARNTLVLTVASIFCNLIISGGDAGYDNTFNVTGEFTSTRNIYVDYDAYIVEDQLLIYANGSLVYDSGCIGTHVTPTVSIPSGTTSCRVVIVPNCTGGSGTFWLVGITCA